MNTERTLYRKMRGEGLGGASMDMEAESGARGKLCENSALLCVVRGLSGSFTSEAVWVPSPASPPVQGQTRLAKKAAAAAEEEEEASAPPAWVG